MFNLEFFTYIVFSDKDKNENGVSADEKGDKNINEETKVSKDENQNADLGDNVDSENKEDGSEKENEKPLNEITKSEESNENSGVKMNNEKNEQELQRSTKDNKDGNEVLDSSLADDNVNPSFKDYDHSTTDLKTDETIDNNEFQRQDQRKLDNEGIKDELESKEASYDGGLQSKKEDEAKHQSSQFKNDGAINEKINFEKGLNKEKENNDDDQNNLEENKHEETREKNDDTRKINEDQGVKDSNEKDRKNEVLAIDKNSAENNEENKQKDQVLKNDENSVKKDNGDKTDGDVDNLQGLINEEGIVQDGDNYRELKFTPSLFLTSFSVFSTFSTQHSIDINK